MAPGGLQPRLLRSAADWLQGLKQSLSSPNPCFSERWSKRLLPRGVGGGAPVLATRHITQTHDTSHRDTAQRCMTRHTQHHTDTKHITQTQHITHTTHHRDALHVTQTHDTSHRHTAHHTHDTSQRRTTRHTHITQSQHVTQTQHITHTTCHRDAQHVTQTSHRHTTRHTDTAHHTHDMSQKCTACHTHTAQSLSCMGFTVNTALPTPDMIAEPTGPQT